VGGGDAACVAPLAARVRRPGEICVSMVMAACGLLMLVGSARACGRVVVVAKAEIDSAF
jgi:hypothetical protein